MATSGAVALAGRGLTLVVGGETLFIENTAGSGGGRSSSGLDGSKRVQVMKRGLK